MKRQATFQVSRTGKRGPKRFAVAVAAGAPARRVARRALVVVPAASANVRTGGFMGLERKFKDYEVSADSFTTVWAGGEMDDGTALSLSAVAQGDGEDQRDGRVYTIHSVHIRGYVELSSLEDSVSPINDVIARIALVWDTQTNGAQLNAEDVYLTTSAGKDVNSFRNLQESKRFIVLKEKTMTLKAYGQTNAGAQNLYTNGAVRIHFKINKAFKNGIKVRCKGTTATVASISDNSLHLIGTANATTVVLNYESRIRFTG